MSFNSPDFFFNIYEVCAWGKIKKRADIYYYDVTSFSLSCLQTSEIECVTRHTGHPRHALPTY
jgi:hypothetical protein